MDNNNIINAAIEAKNKLIKSKGEFKLWSFTFHFNENIAFCRQLGDLFKMKFPNTELSIEIYPGEIGYVMIHRIKLEKEFVTHVKEELIGECLILLFEYSYGYSDGFYENK